MTLTQFLMDRISEEESAWYEGVMLPTTPRFSDISHHMMAEAEAKRQIVKLAIMAGLDKALQGTQPAGREQALIEVLMLLATPYADHPDYREEWKP